MRGSSGLPWPVWAFGGLGIAVSVALIVVLIVTRGSDDPVADNDPPDDPKQVAGKLTAAEWANQLAKAERVHDSAVQTAESNLRTELTRAVNQAAGNKAVQDRLEREQRAFAADKTNLPRSRAVRVAVEKYRTQRTKAHRELTRKLDSLLLARPVDLDPELVVRANTKKRNAERSADVLLGQDLEVVAVNNPKGPDGIPDKPGGGFVKPQPGKNGDAGLVEWKVEVDPPPETFSLPEDYKLSLALPPNTPARNIRFAKGHSPFVAVGKNHSETEVRAVFDLRTKKIVGRIGGFKDFSSNSVLDPFGQFFARANTTTKGVFVWDLAANRVKGTLPLETVNNKYVGFGGKKRLLAIGGGFGTPLNVWKLPSGKPERTIPITKHFDVASLAISPGGRYVAFNETIYKPAVRVYDLNTGKLAGSLSTGFGGTISASCSALEFSPDGKEVAGLFNFGFDEWIACWDVASGKRVFVHQFAERMRFKLGVTHPLPLQWFPNKKRWLLYGQELFDRSAKKIVFSIPGTSNQRITRKVLDDTHITSIAGNAKRPLLVSLKLDEKLIQKQ